MHYAIMVFVVLLGLGGYKIYTSAYDAGWNANKAEVLEVKNQELAQLNQDNIILQNKLDRTRRQHQVVAQNIEHEYREEIRNVENKKARAVADLTHALQLQFAGTPSGGKNEGGIQGKGTSSFISGLAGTEGAKLTPKTRYDLELMSLAGDKAIILLGSCTDTYNAARELE